MVRIPVTSPCGFTHGCFWEVQLCCCWFTSGQLRSARDPGCFERFNIGHSLAKNSKLKICFEGFGQQLQPSRWKAGKLGVHLCMASCVQGRNILIGEAWGKLKGRKPSQKEGYSWKGLGIAFVETELWALEPPSPSRCWRGASQGNSPGAADTGSSFYLLQWCPL